MACVLWGYSAKHWARPMHLDSCSSLACTVSPIIWPSITCGVCRLQEDLNDVAISDQLLSEIGRAFPTRHGLSLHASRSVGLWMGSSEAVVILVPSFLLCDHSPASAVYM